MVIRSTFATNITLSETKQVGMIGCIVFTLGVSCYTGRAPCCCLLHEFFWGTLSGCSCSEQLRIYRLEIFRPDYLLTVYLRNSRQPRLRPGCENLSYSFRTLGRSTQKSSCFASLFQKDSGLMKPLSKIAIKSGQKRCQRLKMSERVSASRIPQRVYSEKNVPGNVPEISTVAWPPRGCVATLF